MAELLALLIGILAGFIEIAGALWGAFVYLLIGTFGVILYAVSPSFRQRRERAWAGQRWKKYIELGGGGFCLAMLVAMSVWIFWPAALEAPGAPERIHFGLEEKRADEDLRFSIGSKTNVVSVKAGGLKEILETKTIHDLTNSLKRNLSVESADTNSKGKTL